MCGIAGVASLHDDQTAVIAAMNNALRHRGPDDEGYLLADWRRGHVAAYSGADTMPQLTLPSLAKAAAPTLLALGHRRLSILDLTASGHGPIPYRGGALWVTFNGEIYNYLELRDELRRKGHTFVSQTDTEVLLAAYAEWGTACLRRLNGMFAFALYDLERKQLFCARDHFGIKPFYYWRTDQLFAFASEIGGLLAHPRIPARPNPAILYDYLALGSLDHTEDTFFEGIKRLPAAHYLLFDLERGSMSLQRWWDVQITSAPNGLPDDDQVAAQYRELLTDAIRLQLRSDVAVGTCLSGGLDSSSLVCLANRLMLEEGALPRELVGERQKTFSAVYDDPAIDERPYIREVIARTGAESNQVFPKGEGGLWHELGAMIRHQGEPFGSTSVYSQWSVMRLAQQRGVTVLLDGQGGDELMAGYHYYSGPFLAQTVRQQGILSALRAARAIWAATGQSPVRLLGLGVYNSFPRKLRQPLMNAANAFFRSRSTTSDAMLAPELVRQYAERRRDHSKHSGFRSLAEHLYQDVFVHSLPALLRYEDHNSMAFSLEARVPLLDHRLVQFCFSLSAFHLIRYGWNKWILRQAMGGVLPEQVRWRRSKLGFATPERRWLQEGRDRIAAMFSQGDILSRPYLSPQTLQRLRNLAQSQAPQLPGLWRLINLEVWLRAFFGNAR